MDERNTWMLGMVILSGLGLVTSLRANRAEAKAEELERELKQLKLDQQRRINRLRSLHTSEVDQLWRAIERDQGAVERIDKRLDTLCLGGQ